MKQASLLLLHRNRTVLSKIFYVSLFTENIALSERLPHKRSADDLASKTHYSTLFFCIYARLIDIVVFTGITVLAAAFARAVGTALFSYLGIERLDVCP